MRFFACREGFKAILPVTIMYNLIAIIGIVLTAIDSHKEAKYVLIILCLVILIINSWFYSQCRYLLAVIILTEEEIQCRFLHKIRKSIRYNDINEYGVYFDKKIRMMYVSKFVITDQQKQQQLFNIYKNSRDVIVFQFQEKAMAVLKEKAVNTFR